MTSPTIYSSQGKFQEALADYQTLIKIKGDGDALRKSIAPTNNSRPDTRTHTNDLRTDTHTQTNDSRTDTHTYIHE